MAEAGDACKGVFGGQGGIYMLDEFRRGAHGNMPACQAAEVHVEIWKKLEAGDESGARMLFNQLLPLLSFERMHGIATYKKVLYRRGIFSVPGMRVPGKYLDKMDLAELDAILEGVEPLFQL